MEGSKSNLQNFSRAADATVTSRSEIAKALSRAALSVCINVLLASGKGAAGDEVILVEDSDTAKI